MIHVATPDFTMADSLYSVRLQGITVVVFIKPCARLGNDSRCWVSRMVWWIQLPWFPAVARYRGNRVLRYGTRAAFSLGSARVGYQDSFFMGLEGLDKRYIFSQCFRIIFEDEIWKNFAVLIWLKFRSNCVDTIACCKVDSCNIAVNARSYRLRLQSANH